MPTRMVAGRRRTAWEGGRGQGRGQPGMGKEGGDKASQVWERRGGEGGVRGGARGGVRGGARERAVAWERDQMKGTKLVFMGISHSQP